VSEDDERYAISAGARATIPCPNGVDPRLFDVPPPPSSGSWLFVGDLGYGPNERGLLWFASRVAPRLPPSRRRTIRIVGRRPTKRLRECARETGLELHADVPDIGPFLAGSAYCFTPVREGAGTSLKVLEYAAAARPIVSTAVGGRGHPFRDLIAVADDSSRFADAMDELERDDRVAAETGRLLRERARDLTWDKMFEPLVGVALGARVS
jgi:glycosyltransferase involved in cell wall biosynthesis